MAPLLGQKRKSEGDLGVLAGDEPYIQSIKKPSSEKGKTTSMQRPEEKEKSKAPVARSKGDKNV